MYGTLRGGPRGVGGRPHLPVTFLAYRYLPKHEGELPRAGATSSERRECVDMLKLVIVVAFVMAPTPTSGECKQSCAKAHAPWLQKCDWHNCRSCADCRTCTPCDDDPGVLKEYLLLNHLTCATHHYGLTKRCNNSQWWRDEHICIGIYPLPPHPSHDPS